MGRGAAPRMADALRRGAQGQNEDGFAFLPALHEPGTHTVRGKRYSQSGMNQGEAVIRDLCSSPATARFIATKLVRHFVADVPPPGAIARVADAFTASDGNLTEVAKALIDLPEAWDPGHRKIRTPQDWLSAVLRAVGAREAPPNLTVLMRQLRHPLWEPASPKGFGDMTQEWADPDSLMNRAELARTLADRASRNSDPAVMLLLIDIAPADPLIALVTDESIEAPERLALAIAGPAFQWR